MEKRSWIPKLTSQFLICPVPFHLDTYHGCSYNCLYCFARETYEFLRRASEFKNFSHLVVVNPHRIKKWIDDTIKKEDYDYTKGNEVALQERIPLKIGANSDPFPHVEKKEKVTREILKAFGEYDYPLEIQTKNPSVLASYIDDFSDVNWNIAVSIVTDDDDFCKFIEPHAPSLNKRYEGIKQLTDAGIKVMIKIQPTFYQTIFEELPDMVKRFVDAGCWAFNTEGLKMRRLLEDKYLQYYRNIGDYLGFDIIKFYEMEDLANRFSKIENPSDFEVRKERKLEYTKFAVDIAEKNDVKYFVADNYMGKMGDGDECCGTEVLRDYKIHGLNFRSTAFNNTKKGSDHLKRCYVNFTRSTNIPLTKNHKTIEQTFFEEKRKIESARRQRSILRYFRSRSAEEDK